MKTFLEQLDSSSKMGILKTNHPEFAKYNFRYTPSLGETIARYEPDGTIVVTDAFFDHNLENQREILAHEVGHGKVAHMTDPEHIQEFWKLVESGLLGRYDEEKGRFVGLWGQRNADEVLAELAARYYINPQQLKNKYPLQYDIIEKIIQDHN